MVAPAILSLFVLKAPFWSDIVFKLLRKATKILTTEVAAPSAAIRSEWGHGSVASGLTPQRLAGILSAAADGDTHSYLTLAEEMEERDPHYSSVLRTRKLAVAGLPVTVTAGGEDKQATNLAESVRQLTDTPRFHELIDNSLDALGKGFSVSEIIWDRSGKTWEPAEYRWRDPRFFMFHPDRPFEIRLIDESDTTHGLPLPQHKFIIHQPRLKSGLALRGGLARLVAFSYVCKMYGMRDWLSFAEIYGIPLRLGKYGPASSPDDRKILRTAVANIGSDAAAILPESMQIEFQQINQAAGASEVFARLVEWLDRQVSKAVLGQTMTTDDGSSRAQATVHDSVRQDIIDADASQLAATLNRDLVRSYIDINYGPQDVYPRIEISVPEQEDLATLADNLSKLVPLGLRVSGAEVRAKLGLSEPDSDAEVLGATGPEVAETGQRIAANRATTGETETETEIDDWGDAWEPLTDAALDAVKNAGSYDELIESLPGAVKKTDVKPLADKLAEGGIKSYTDGRENAE